jgi:hypothetical protein
VASLEDFDRYVEENSIADGDLAQAFADWLAKASGKQASANGGQGIRTADGNRATPGAER